MSRLFFLSLLLPIIFFLGWQVLPSLGGLEREALFAWATAGATLEALIDEGLYEPAAEDNVCITGAGDPVGITLFAFESAPLRSVTLGSIWLNAGWVRGRRRIGWQSVVELCVVPRRQLCAGGGDREIRLMGL